MAEPSNDETRPRGGIGWTFWIAGGVGLLFVIVYAVGGCMLRTIC